MTNAQIIFNESVRLVEEGKLGTTGRTLTVEYENGETRQIPEPLPIHTYDEWKRMGLQVRRGEHAVAAFKIWVYNRKPVTMKAKDVKTGEDVEITEDAGNYIMKTAFFFAPNQVSAPEEKPETVVETVSA